MQFNSIYIVGFIRWRSDSRPCENTVHIFRVIYVIIIIKLSLRSL